MPHLASDLQLDWDVDELCAQWPNRLDHRFLLNRLAALTAETALAGGAARVLDVAAAEAEHAAEMSLRGVRTVALDPSPVMLERARAHAAGRGAQVTLVRGIAETLPFRDDTFDRVLCHSAIDHVADPERAVREMTRVLTSDGRLVISAVNYAGLSARLSRVLYEAARRLRLIDRRRHRFWDSPVPVEHTFECTAGVLRRLCAPYLELERVFGVSLGWGVPGWGALLERLPAGRAFSVLCWLDRHASRNPARADFVYLVGRPRPRRTWPVHVPPECDGFVVQPGDLVYHHRAGGERLYWNLASFAGTIIRPGPAGARLANMAYTGDPARSWLDDLAARGPFRDAAVLGCDEERYDAEWLDRGGSPRLDVYELNRDVMRKVRTRLGRKRRRVRFIAADLNFAALPAERYDVIWSSGCLHHIVNLEHLYAQIERALRPGGLFALHDYVGEPRMQYSAARLRCVNALLDQIPLRYRRDGVVVIRAPEERGLSPFCAARANEVLPLAAARFEPVHRAELGGLFPLPFHLDVEAMARDDPALLARLTAAEEEARRDPAIGSSSAYAVFRKRR